MSALVFLGIAFLIAILAAVAVANFVRHRFAHDRTLLFCVLLAGTFFLSTLLTLSLFTKAVTQQTSF
jgi:hypothetical protein